MKTAKIVSIVCWLVTALILIGLAIWFLTGNLFGFRTGFKLNTPAFGIDIIDNLTGPMNEVGTYTVPADGIDTIDVNWISGAASITPYDGDTIKITEYARRDLNDNEKLVYNVSGGKLEIKYISPSLRINMISKNLELLVPKSIANKLDKLNINATSADLNVSDFEVKLFEVHETSGESELINIKATTADVHSISGTIDITAMTASDLNMSTVSGEIFLTDVTADTVKSGTTSGEQEFSGTFKDIDAGSVSGEVNIASSVDPDKIFCHTTSGDITVALPGASDLTVSYSTVSGDFNSDIPVKTGGSASYRFTSVSGSIYLRAA